MWFVPITLTSVLEDCVALPPDVDVAAAAAADDVVAVFAKATVPAVALELLPQAVSAAAVASMAAIVIADRVMRCIELSSWLWPWGRV